MTRKAEVTVRLPGASSAPTSKTCACWKTGLENNGAKATIRFVSSRGSVSMGNLLLAKWSPAYAASRFLFKDQKWIKSSKEARERGFQPACVVFDSWYSGLENLKLIRSFDWIWLTRLKSNRKVNPEREGLRAVSEVEV